MLVYMSTRALWLHDSIRRHDSIDGIPRYTRRRNEKWSQEYIKMANLRHAVMSAVKFEIDNSNNKAFRNGWEFHWIKLFSNIFCAKSAYTSNSSSARYFSSLVGSTPSGSGLRCSSSQEYWVRLSSMSVRWRQLSFTYCNLAGEN